MTTNQQWKELILNGNSFHLNWRGHPQKSEWGFLMNATAEIDGLGDTHDQCLDIMAVNGFEYLIGELISMLLYFLFQILLKNLHVFTLF